MYLLLAVELTSLAKAPHARLRAWRAIHWLSFPLFGLVQLHLLLAGTDRQLAVGACCMRGGRRPGGGRAARSAAAWSAEARVRDGMAQPATRLTGRSPGVGQAMATRSSSSSVQ